MLRPNTLISVVLFMTTVTQALDKPAYTLYQYDGSDATYDSMISDVQDADILFFGEMHSDPIAHWLQLEITSDLHSVHDGNLVIGAEMFEADDQMIIDEYLANHYSESKFQSEVKLWGNYSTDYKPVLDFALEHDLHYIATNIPRRYASMIHHSGFESLAKLSVEARSLIGPKLEELYDPTVQSYANMMKMEGMGAHVNENFPKAQAAKDATMAHFILQNQQSKGIFLHLNGAYHSDNFEGIVWWIKNISPNQKTKTISTVYQDDLSSLNEVNLNRADYIIVVPSNMTKTYL